MVGSIKNRIAAFEDMAVKSKSEHKIMSILPPEQGFAASKNRSSILGPNIQGKETYGNVPSPPLKSNDYTANLNVKTLSAAYKSSRNTENELFKNDLNVYERFKKDKAAVSEQESAHSSPSEFVVPETVEPKKAIQAQVLQENVEPKKAAQAPQENVEPDAQVPQEYVEQKNAVNGPFNGPVSAVSVTSNDHDSATSDHRDQSISPLSFQGYKISSKPSHAEGRLSHIQEDTEVSNVYDEESAYSADIRSRVSNKEPSIGEESVYSAGVRSYVSNKDSSIGEPSKEESEDRNDEEELHIDHIFQYSFLRREDSLSFASENGATMESGMSESKNDFAFARVNPPMRRLEEQEEHEVREHSDIVSPINIDGPSIEGQEEYDNFTLGSGESDDEPIPNNEEMMTKGQSQPAEMKGEKDQNAASNKGPSVYVARNPSEIDVNGASEHYDPLESKKKTIDPLFLEDDWTDTSGSSRGDSKNGDDNSFSEYLDNMRPVPSFDDDNEKEECDDEKEKDPVVNGLVNGDGNGNIPLMDELPMNDYVYVSEDEEELDFEDNLSDKVEDDVLHVGERMVQEVVSQDEGSNEGGKNKGDDYVTAYDYISGDDEDTFEQADVDYEITQEFDLDDEGIVQEDLMHDIKIHGNDNVPFDEMGHQREEDSSKQVNFHDGQRQEDTPSPMSYKEEDFEDDEGENFEGFNDEETVETTDLLGVNFDELSVVSDGKESTFVNPTNGRTPQYPSQATYAATSCESGLEGHGTNASNFHFESYQTSQDGIDSTQKKMQSKQHELEGSRKTHLLSPITEEQPVEPHFVTSTNPRHKREHYVRPNPGSGPPLTIIKNTESTLSQQNDEISVITDSTYDIGHRRTKWKTSLDPHGHSTQESKSEKSESSLMTYSLSETSNPSIVSKANNGPIFRSRNSLSDNMKLKTVSSNISEITDPHPPGFGRRRPNPKTGRRKSSGKDNASLSTINGASAGSSSPQSRGRDRSPFGRSGRSGKLPEQKSSQKLGGGRGRQEERETKPSRGFSWRSLSPFRRHNSTKGIDKSLLKAQEEFRTSQGRLERLGGVQRERSFGSNGSTPAEVLQEDDARESKIPLVAVSLSDDSSQLRKPKKRFSLRDLSPFRRRSSRKKKGKNDPFDEGGESN